MKLIRPSGQLAAGIAMLVSICFATSSSAQQFSAGPNDPGASYNDVTFGTVAWTTPGNATTDDGAYAQGAPGGGDTNYLHSDNFGFNVPSPAVIDGIEVAIERHALSGTIKDSRVRIVKGGVVGATEKGDLINTWPLVDTVKTYGANNDLWGETWTAGDINASNFGVVLSVTDSADLALVDHVAITVYFSLCTPAPIGGCRTSLKSLFLVKDSMDDTKDKLVFKWIKGQATSQPEFADPINTAIYAVCVYENNALSFPLAVSPSSLWSVISTKGYKYKNLAGTEFGVQKIIVKGSVDPKAKILVKGKGLSLPDPVPPLTLPVKVQVINSDSGICWDATFTTFKKNQAGLYKAKNP
jgi:hypothetical protein